MYVYVNVYMNMCYNCVQWSCVSLEMGEARESHLGLVQAWDLNPGVPD